MDIREIVRHLDVCRIDAGSLLVVNPETSTLMVMQRINGYWEPLRWPVLWPVGNDKQFVPGLDNADVAERLAKVTAKSLGFEEALLEIKQSGARIYELRARA